MKKNIRTASIWAVISFFFFAKDIVWYISTHQFLSIVFSVIWIIMFVIWVMEIIKEKFK